MNSKLKMLTAAASLMVLSACAYNPPVGQAYWQRVEDNSALWMTGPKAQQELDQNIATCVREVDELVEIGALRETMPPDTHDEYHKALNRSGDLDYYDTPTRLGDHMVAHTDFHDFESCMRDKGWERVKFIRYQTAAKSKQTYKSTQQIRTWGVSGDVAVQKQQENLDEIKGDYNTVNK